MHHQPRRYCARHAHSVKGRAGRKERKREREIIRLPSTRCAHQDQRAVLIRGQHRSKCCKLCKHRRIATAGPTEERKSDVESTCGMPSSKSKWFYVTKCKLNNAMRMSMSYHFFRGNSSPGITDTLRFWMCTNSIDRGRSDQSACVSCLCRTACDNWDMFRHRFLFPISSEFPANLKWERETRRDQWIEINKIIQNCLAWWLEALNSFFITYTLAGSDDGDTKLFLFYGFGQMWVCASIYTQYAEPYESAACVYESRVYDRMIATVAHEWKSTLIYHFQCEFIGILSII